MTEISQDVAHMLLWHTDIFSHRLFSPNLTPLSLIQVPAEWEELQTSEKVLYYSCSYQYQWIYLYRALNSELRGDMSGHVDSRYQWSVISLVRGNEGMDQRVAYIEARSSKWMSKRVQFIGSSIFIRDLRKWRQRVWSSITRTWEYSGIAVCTGLGLRLRRRPLSTTSALRHCPRYRNLECEYSSCSPGVLMYLSNSL